MQQISYVKEKQFMSSLNICPEACNRICKLLRTLGIDSNESISPVLEFFNNLRGLGTE
jgi:hypothetical protein